MRWLPVVGYEGLYEVSDDGQVRSLDRLVLYRDGREWPLKGRVLTPWMHRFGYPCVSLSRGNKRRGREIHALVLEAFVGPRPAGMECRHLNGDPRDSRLVNLCWGTPKQNEADKLSHGTWILKDVCPKCGGDYEVMTGARRCRSCNNAGARERYHKRKARDA